MAGAAFASFERWRRLCNRAIAHPQPDGTPDPVGIRTLGWQHSSHGPTDENANSHAKYCTSIQCRIVLKVEVVELRRLGKKLSAAEEVTALQLGRVGYLMLFMHRERSGERCLIARLLPRPNELVVSLLEQLENVQLNALRGNRFVLAGTQHDRRGDKSYGTFPQGWLCKVMDSVSSDQQMP